jgi:acyl dehydratase
MTTVAKLDDLPSLVGTHLGYSDWRLITQEQINLFADATGDHQWIHVDPERAKSGPFGGPIAHGYLTLSLVPGLMGQVFAVEGVTMGVNYGANKVRFPSPVPVGAELRMGATLAGVEEVSGGVQVTLDVTLEVKDATKPSCAAQVVYRFYR